MFSLHVVGAGWAVRPTRSAFSPAARPSARQQCANLVKRLDFPAPAANIFSGRPRPVCLLLAFCSQYMTKHAPASGAHQLGGRSRVKLSGPPDTGSITRQIGREAAGRAVSCSDICLTSCSTRPGRRAARGYRPPSRVGGSGEVSTRGEHLIGGWRGGGGCLWCWRGGGGIG